MSGNAEPGSPLAQAWRESLNTMVSTASDGVESVTNSRTVAQVASQAKAAGRAAVTMLQNLPATVKRRLAEPVASCGGSEAQLDDTTYVVRRPAPEPTEQPSEDETFDDDGDDDKDKVEALKILTFGDRVLFTASAVAVHCVILRLLVGDAANYWPLVIVGLIAFVAAMIRGPDADNASAAWHLERYRAARRQIVGKPLEDELRERLGGVRAIPGTSLPRAPTSGQPMTWEPSPKTFFLRSKDYLKDKKKIPSPPALYEPFAADLLRSRDPFYDLAKFVALPPKTPAEARLPSWLPRILVQNMFFPGTPPPILFGDRQGQQKSSTAPPGYMVVCYWRVTQETMNLVKDDNDEGYPPHLRLWKRYARNAGRAPVLNGCLKGVASVDNLDDKDLGLPGLVRRYNAKPVLMAASAFLGERPGVVKVSQDTDAGYFEFALNVGTDFAAMSNQALHQMKPTFPKLVLDIGWLIEGRSFDDLPEGLISAMRINNVDLTQATDIDDWLRTEPATIPTTTSRDGTPPKTPRSRSPLSATLSSSS